MDVSIYLDFPPTLNSYYTKTRNGIFISRKGRLFRDSVIKEVSEQVPDKFIDTQMLMQVTLFMPDKRERDLDNYMKALLDAMTHAHLIADDSLVDQLMIYRGEVVKYGLTKVVISPAGPIIPQQYAHTDVAI